MNQADGHPLLLASGSRYRADLLQRLGVAFQAQAADVDESPRPGEAPGDLAMRLARAKAAALQRRSAQAWVIGSDQVADCAGRILGKPIALAEAQGQLRAASGRSVDFHTSVCVLGPGGFDQMHCDLTRVQFRTLDDTEIARYLEREPALDCAGSFKAEGLGIALFEAIESRDPSALVGLPLIALAGMLRSAGFKLP